MGKSKLVDYLHKRIIDNCFKLFEDEYFRQSATTALIEVELALKEKVGEKNLFGTRLIDKYLSSGDGIKLKVPFGVEMQSKAKGLFKSSFSYYRNYCAHDGRKVNKNICYRVLILASELLDLIDASALSYSKIGGIKGLIENKIFESEERITELLEFLSTQQFPDEVFDGMFEEMYLVRNFSEAQYLSVFDFGLIEYREKNRIDEDNPFDPRIDWEIFGWLELTNLGETVLVETKKSFSNKKNE